MGSRFRDALLAAHLLPMRVLFFNEGNLGSHTLGQAVVERSLRAGVAATADVDGRFVGLTEMGRLARAAAYRRVPPLSRVGLDLPTLRWHLMQSARARRVLSRELKAWPADLLYLHTQSVGLLARGLMRRLPVALSADTAIREWWTMPAWRPTHKHAAALIAPSAMLERRALESAAVVFAFTSWAQAGLERCAPQANVVEHHPGIDLARFRPAPRRERERPRVLFVGGRFAEKGGHDLLAALQDDIGSTLDLDVVTPAPIAERPGLRVHRLGHSDPELLDLQQQADVFCLPTYGDAAPWAVLEAMACGTPVVSTRIGGIPNMLDGGRAGVLVGHGDCAGLADAVRTLLADPARRAELGALAHRRCEQRYDQRRQFLRLIEHLRAAIVDWQAAQ